MLGGCVTGGFDGLELRQWRTAGDRVMWTQFERHQRKRAGWPPGFNNQQSATCTVWGLPIFPHGPSMTEHNPPLLGRRWCLPFLP